MGVENKMPSIAKKWHQKWWGITFLIIVSVGLVYLATYIYMAVYYIEMRNNAFKEQYLELQKNTQATGSTSRAQLETLDDPSSGAKDAPITIVEFSDFQCIYCLQAYPALKRIREEYPDKVRIIYRDMPNLASHPNALNAASAGECADEQGKFWEYHDLLFNNQADLSVSNLKSLSVMAGLDQQQFEKCFDDNKYLSEVQNDLQDGIKYGVNSTPTFFFNGNKAAGAISYDAFKQIIDKYLAQINNQ